MEVSRSADDRWRDALAGELPGLRVGVPRSSLHSVLRETLNWATWAPAAAWRRHENVVSLQQDLDAASRFCGSRTSALLGSSVVEVCARLGEIYGSLNGSDQGRAAIACVEHAAESVLNALHRADARVAGWLDLVDAAREDEPVIEVVGARSDLLRAILDGAGVDPGPVFSRLSAYLAPSPSTIGAFSRAGEGLALDDSACLAACSQTVERQPESANVVVWLSYTHAFFNGMVEAHGPVTFYDADWAIQNALGQPGQDFPFRQEFERVIAADPDLGTFDAHAPMRRAVLVRVELGYRRAYGAIEDAAAALDSIMDIVATTSGAPRWHRGRFHCVVTDGQVTSSILGGLNAGERTALRTEPDYYGWRGFADALDEYTPELVTVLDRGRLEPSLREGLRLTVEAGQVDSRENALAATATIAEHTVVMLQATAVEHFAVHAGMRRDELTAITHKAWMLASLNRDLTIAIDQCLAGRPDRDGRSDPALTGVITYGRHGRSYSFLAAFRARDALLASCPNPFHRARARRLFSALGDPQAALDLLHESRAATALSAARWRRCRNAMAHGNPASIETLTSVRDCSRFTAGQALHLSLRAVTERREPSAVVHSDSADYDKIIARLASGVSLVEQWSAVQTE